jgi:hypothetical protein
LREGVGALRRSAQCFRGRLEPTLPRHDPGRPPNRYPADPLLLVFANGAPYNPRGRNVAFEDGNPDLNGTPYYDLLLSSLASAGENWTRF